MNEVPFEKKLLVTYMEQLRHGIHSYMKHVVQNTSTVEFDEFHLYRNVKIIEQSRNKIFI